MSNIDDGLEHEQKLLEREKILGEKANEVSKVKFIKELENGLGEEIVNYSASKKITWKTKLRNFLNKF